jgi:tRNA dimethylallyltransferase
MTHNIKPEGHHTDILPPAILLMGPTASGKSNVAMEIAKFLPIEIISVDSAQVYRHMNIGTAKPDTASLKLVPHHLINLIDPDQRYSAAEFRIDALKKIHEITMRRKVPVLVGGTMLYFRALQQGLSELPPANEALRLTIEAMAKKIGWPAMHKTLSALDPIIATRIKPTDSQRIQRALEVCYLTNQPMSEIQKISKDADFPYHMIKIALIPSDRSVLHQRIAQRFRDMARSGLIDEIQSIRQRFQVDAASPAMRCVGYRQGWLYLDNKINLDQFEEMGIAATRQLAKRQLTWLRNMQLDELNVFDCLARDLSDRVLMFLQAMKFHATID